jgi:pilus assembly protein Flp/PilA
VKIGEIMNTQENKQVADSNNERGASMVEYAIMVALIAIIAIAAVTTLGRSVSNQFSTTAAQIN